MSVFGSNKLRRVVGKSVRLWMCTVIMYSDLVSQTRDVYGYLFLFGESVRFWKFKITWSGLER